MFKADTGAQANVIPVDTFYETFGNVRLGPPNSYISGYGGQRLKVKGACKLTCK